MTDETQPTVPPPAPAPPIPKVDAPLPPRSGQHLTEATATRHDVAQATRPPWPKLDADKPEPGHKMGKRQCIGRSTLSGKRCGNPPCAGKERCKFHGGRTTGRPPKKGTETTRKNVASGSSGRYFEAMGKLAASYSDALSDNALTDTREPLAALDALTRRALKRTEECDTPEFRKRMLELLEGARDAMTQGDVDRFTLLINSALELARSGTAEDVATRTATETLIRFSERVDAYWKTKLDRKQAINARDLTLIFERIVDIVQSEVTGEAALRVAKAIDALMLSTARFDRDADALASGTARGGVSPELN